RWIGACSNPVAFSFYATKNLTTGEGGMLTGESDFLERARIISLHGMSVNAWNRYGNGGSWFYEVVLPGFKYNMTDIQASLGLCQLRKIAHIEQLRREIVELYQYAFRNHDAFELPVERPQVEHAWHLYVLRLRPGVLRCERDRFIHELAEHNIGASVHFIPLHLHPYVRDRYGYAPNDFPVAYDNYLRMISLPLSPCMTELDGYDVVDAELDIASTYAR
ncbi:MAG: DegT/DnrJ/EryC1/StrS family aminotransferase, partial [Longimicrobiales bacterium]